VRRVRQVRQVRPVRQVLAAAILAAAAACSAPAATPANDDATLKLPQETHLSNIRQLTTSGENAEAYFSFDGKKLSFQSTGEYPCDQIYTMNIDGSDRKLISTGTGRTTCSHFLPDGKSIVYASTHLGAKECPPVPGREEGYVWPIYDTYDIFKVNIDGTGLTQLTNTPGYDAEATVAKDGRIVFTSVRNGDMDIYSMNADGSDVKQLTNLPGPDGGAFFSADGSQIVFRGRHPEKGKELDEYFTLLKKGLWKPAGLDVFVMNRDGSNLHAITTGLGGANWAPFFLPDGKRIIFASNMKDPHGGNFDLYLINADGTGLEQVTFSPTFDGFPMFSPDGRKLVFASNRHSVKETDTNLFIADWK
jgi:Tol biopolymer transport system component